MMTAIGLWLYGVLAFSSVIMIVGWGGTAVDMIKENTDGFIGLVWCKPVVIATGLTIQSTAFAFACGYRSYDIVWNHIVVFGSEVAIQLGILMTFGFSKMLFVWAASIIPGKRSPRWYWWAYLYLMSVWGVAVAAYANFALYRLP
jgi:hypothetical protein